LADILTISAGGADITGEVNMNNSVISNIGNAGTDFSATGGLTLADILTISAGGADITGEVNMNNSVISNIGNTGTDFNSDGGLALADQLTISSNGADVTGNIELRGGNQLRIYESAGSEYTSFQSPALANNVEYTLPAEQGTANSVLQNDGSGVLDWGLRIFRAVVTTDVGPIPINGHAQINLAVPGAETGSSVMVSPNNVLPDGVVLSFAYMSASEVVLVRFNNLTGAEIPQFSRTFYVTVIK
jgi:hypothetical protein